MRVVVALPWSEGAEGGGQAGAVAAAWGRGVPGRGAGF